ncbi:MAG: DUF4867 family protein [Lachnospiraceae bacterium]|nr:DUF4867 family protein [Lachnospiraceae bacterium]
MKKQEGYIVKFVSVHSELFEKYGKVLKGYDVAPLLSAMEKIDLPAEGVAYEPAIDSLEACTDLYKEFTDRAYGGMPVQVGMCWGRNTKLNCLEYHRGCELNIGTTAFVLLLAKASDIHDGKLDTKDVVAFTADKGDVVLVYEDTLHYAPCQQEGIDGFRVAIVLPKGTNTDKPEIKVKNEEDGLLWARNKWLIAHADSSEAKSGAYVGLTGKNIDISVD